MPSFAVLTRDPAAVEPYAAALAPLGLEVVAMPLTRYESVDADLTVAADFIAVASPRAAQELARAGAPKGEVWALGQATARVLADASITAIVPEGVRDGAGLARALAPKVSGKRVLVPRAEGGRPELCEELRTAGAEVIDVVAYRTIRVAADDPAIERGLQLLRSAACAVCVVFAPSQAIALLQLVTPETRFVAIGETTATALKAAGMTAVAIATSPTPEGIASAVSSVYPKST